MTALYAAAETAAWVALPVVVLAIVVGEKRLKRRADRRWAEQQKAAARRRTTDAEAWDDIVHRLTRGEPKP